MLTKIGDAKLTLPARNLLFWAGGAAALLAALVFRRNWSAEWELLKTIGLITTGPAAAPTTAGDWIELLRFDRFLGLVLLNFFDVFNYALFGLVLIALFAALRRQGEARMFVALGLGFVGIVVYLASNQALSLAALSDQYALASNEAQRQLILAGAQGVLAVNFRESFSNGGLYVSFLCTSLAGLLTATVMLKSRVFGRATAVIGLLANGFALGYYVLLLIAPGLVAVTISISSVFFLLWYILIALRFFFPPRPAALVKGKPAVGPHRRRLR
jgi:hypothetical protein